MTARELLNKLKEVETIDLDLDVCINIEGDFTSVSFRGKDENDGDPVIELKLD